MRKLCKSKGDTDISLSNFLKNLEDCGFVEEEASENGDVQDQDQFTEKTSEISDEANEVAVEEEASDSGDEQNQDHFIEKTSEISDETNEVVV